MIFPIDREVAERQAAPQRGGMALRPGITQLVLRVALLVAVALRLATPAGWMPNIDGRPGSWLVVCTGHGPALQQLPGDHDPAPAKDKAQHEHCAFSGLAFADPPAVPAFPPPARFAAVARLPGRDVAPTAGPDRRRPQSQRAPPLSL
jgi:hypothetical protein